MKRLSVLVLVAAVLLAVPAAAADRVIANGVDLWRTASNGSTFADFAKTPLPAGFFCFKSEPFTGRIGFRGVPVATSVPGALGDTDTIVQRLDDAVFNKRGVAFTRVQVRALNFESLSPVKTACGDFVAKVSLDGEQPITRMRIVRENAAGGRFFVPIAVNIKISFTPVGQPATEPLEVRQQVRFPPLPNQRWTRLEPQNAKAAAGFLLVDTDGDRTPDTYLPGTSNFGVGRTRATKLQTIEDCALSIEPVDCHVHDGGTHCVC
jgi:hypothetical protein